MAKKRGRKGYARVLRQVAEKRLAAGANVDELALELGVHRRTLYRWRQGLDPKVNTNEELATTEREVLQRQVHRLSQLLAEKTLEVDFFRGALQKIEARRQRRASSGAKTSTMKSEK